MTNNSTETPDSASRRDLLRKALVGGGLVVVAPAALTAFTPAAAAVASAPVVNLFQFFRGSSRLTTLVTAGPLANEAANAGSCVPGAYPAGGNLTAAGDSGPVSLDSITAIPTGGYNLTFTVTLPATCGFAGTNAITVAVTRPPGTVGYTRCSSSPAFPAMAVPPVVTGASTATFTVAYGFSDGVPNLVRMRVAAVCG